MNDLYFDYKNLREKKPYKTRMDVDVYMSVIKRKDSNDAVTITFYNGSEKKITNGDYIVFAIDGDRMYLNGDVNNITGWKLSDCPNNHRRLYISRDNLLEFVKANRGYHNLSYDKDRELYYIDCEGVRK